MAKEKQEKKAEKFFDGSTAEERQRHLEKGREPKREPKEKPARKEKEPEREPAHEDQPPPEGGKAE